MQDVPLPNASALELDAAILQAAITLSLQVLSLALYRRYRKPWFLWWAAAWALYVLRIGAIVSFLLSANRLWLYWHQVLTGWTALALLWAALVFSRQLPWRRAYWAVALFPPVWSYLAIYRIEEFALAAGPAVVFLSLATLWSGWVFLQHWRRVGAAGAGLLAAAFLLWGLHHLDYPFLRAKGAWAPWGYYLDIMFELAVGVGFVVLVNDDLRRGLAALSALSGNLQRRQAEHDVLDTLVEEPLRLPAVRGSALYLGGDDARFVRGAGACAAWQGTAPVAALRPALDAALARGRPAVVGGLEMDGRAYPFVACLPIFTRSRASGALVLVGDARDPFTALDDRFLVTLGEQVGAALENADLERRLQARTVELARLSATMVEQHEAERRRLSRELHDEAAQVFSAVKMELATLRGSLPTDRQPRLDRALALVDTGIQSIRGVVRDLRPPQLEDLGLLPSLRALASDFTARTGLPVAMEASATLPALARDAELALYRALQEALSNVLRHAAATAVSVTLEADATAVRLEVRDNGRGPPADADPARLEREGHLGLAGMRERISALGGQVQFGRGDGHGARLAVEVPVRLGSAA